MILREKFTKIRNTQSLRYYPRIPFLGNCWKLTQGVIKNNPNLKESKSTPAPPTALTIKVFFLGTLVSLEDVWEKDSISKHLRVKHSCTTQLYTRYIYVWEVLKYVHHINSKQLACTRSQGFAVTWFFLWVFYWTYYDFNGFGQKKTQGEYLPG